MTSRLVLLLAAGLAGTALAGCAGAPAPVPTPRPTVVESPGAFERYVALGDSYTAAPYVGITRLENGCLRSERNYPALLAERLRVRTLVDVSCAGAATRHLSAPQRPFGGDAVVPPQLGAVTPDTDLVTLGIGGNDEGLFRRLLGRNDLGDTRDVEADIRLIGRSIARSVRAVRARAPHAVVVVVGYPRLAGARACPGRLPVAAGLVDEVDRMTRLLRDRMRAAARAGGARFADLYGPSKGHDVCSREPWVNGMQSRPRVAMALHPLAAEQQAVSALLTRMLDR